MLLQAWWRRMKTVILLRKIMADYRWKMAVRIQGVWRAWSQWRKFASKKRLWLEELAVMRIAATVGVHTQGYHRCPLPSLYPRRVSQGHVTSCRNSKPSGGPTWHDARCVA